MRTGNHKYFFLLVLLFCTFSGCNKFSDKNPDFFLEMLFINNDERLLNYDAVNESQREPFFIEEFDDNISKFPLEIGIHGDAEVSVTDGKMTIKYFTNSLDCIRNEPVPIKIDESRNFEMETSLIVDRKDSVGHSHTFARVLSKTIGNGYDIEYSQYEKENNVQGTSTKEKVKAITLWYLTDERKWKLEYEAKSFLNSNKFTVLTIRKIENKYAIFINFKLFYIISDKNFSYIPTITMDCNVVNVFDYFRVYYLP